MFWWLLEQNHEIFKRHWAWRDFNKLCECDQSQSLLCFLSEMPSLRFFYNLFCLFFPEKLYKWMCSNILWGFMEASSQFVHVLCLTNKPDLMNAGKWMRWVNSWAGFWSLFSNLFHQQRAQLSTTCKPKQKGFIAAAPHILVLGAPPPSVESYPKQGTPAVWERKMVSDDV